MQVLPYFYVRCGAVVPQEGRAAGQFMEDFHVALEQHLQQLAAPQQAAGTAHHHDRRGAGAGPSVLLGAMAWSRLRSLCLWSLLVAVA